MSITEQYDHLDAEFMATLGQIKRLPQPQRLRAFEALQHCLKVVEVTWKRRRVARVARAVAGMVQQ